MQRYRIKSVKMNAKERLLEFLTYLNIGQTAFEKKISIANGYISHNKGSLGSEIISKISDVYPDLDLEWLITGKGDMLKSDIPSQISFSDFKQRGYSPCYSDLKVSAGQYDLARIEQSEEPDSWIMFPGVTAEAWFPIVGCSMEPKIYAGDMIGVIKTNRWDRLDPDKTYLIITNDDRMVKHLEVDEKDTQILWAVSENHPKFKIYVDEIKQIFRVVWSGRLV